MDKMHWKTLKNTLTNNRVTSIALICNNSIILMSYFCTAYKFVK